MGIALETLCAYELGEMVNKRAISPTEVLKYFENRIKTKDTVNAFVYTKFDEAYKRANELEKRLAKGEYCGPFAGVPFALKDFLPSKKGWTHSHGGVKCLIKEDEYTGTFCKAMEEAGGIAVGKCNAPAYGFRGTTDNKLYGPTSTPYNLKYNAGGSSGGSAAAVALGLVLIAEGGDAGGSIRIPAAFCNLYGFKAGIGTLPNVCRPDAYSTTHPYCFSGGLTKCVKDSAILLKYMAKYDPKDPFSLPQNIDYEKEFDKPFKDLKIAYTDNFNLFSVDPTVVLVVRHAVQMFSYFGATIEYPKFHFKHSALELAEEWCKGITVDCAIELNNNKIDLLKEHRDDFPDEFIEYKEKCDKMTINDLYKFNLARTDVLDNFEDVFKDYDFIISPTVCVDGIRNSNDRNTKGPDEINGQKTEQLIGWTETFLANFTGNPAASIPAGFAHSLPVGMQIIGKRHHDIEVLQLSNMFEKINPWINKYPY